MIGKHGVARTAGAAAAAALAVLALAAAHDERSSAQPDGVAFRAVGAAPRVARLARAEWWGGAATATTGETVTVYVSAAYAPDQGAPRRWADFFAGLLHGAELARVNVYVAPPAEVGALCGTEDALGCYGGGRLVVPGDAGGGIEPKVVAAHEYGHHVAANRDNAPWRAVEWGTKRWASHLNVCARARDGSLFPGDEAKNYRLNPGEGFAEAYRVLNETRTGTPPFGWQIVDSTFIPDAAALAAIEEDVLRPWGPSPVTTLRARFVPKGRRIWRSTIATPLDGDLAVAVSLPPAAAYEVDLLAADGRKVLVRGLWSGTAQKSLRYTVCGERSLLLRVTRYGAPGSVRVEVSRP